MNVNYDELILVVSGTFLTVLGIVKLNERNKLKKTGIKVNGEVIRLEESFSSERRILYHPVFRYQTQENDWIEKRSEIGTNPSLYKDGESLVIIYDATDKEHFIVDNFLGRIIGPILIVVGVLLLIGVAVYYILHQT